MSASTRIVSAQGAGRRCLFVTHAEVVIDPAVAVERWGLSEMGRRRHHAFNGHEAVQAVGAVHASGEQKALDGAGILAAARGLPVLVAPALHENDRTATGYLPPAEFERTADVFFAEPMASVRGWERAVDAQRRVVQAVQDIMAADRTDGDIAIVAHGGVGALLLAHASREPISRRWDQPGRGGGNFFVLSMVDCEVLQGWMSIG